MNEVEAMQIAHLEASIKMPPVLIPVQKGREEVASEHL